MSDYLSARLYQRESSLGAWSPPTLGSADDLKAKVKGLVEAFGQPSGHSFTESKEADVIRLTWESRAEVRLVMDKLSNYELIHCPSCGRPIMPPPHSNDVRPCLHGWAADWVFDQANNMWRCSSVARDTA